MKIPLLRLKLLLLPGVLLVSGCSSFSYYLEMINGHANILNQQRPVSEVLKDPQTSPALRDALINIQQARDFAVTKLYLPDNGSYRYYANIHREYAVWNVVAAPRLSVNPKQWCYVFAGCFNYRGFFSEQEAKDYATQLQQQDYDTYVAGARAYSTLGWLEDPLLNTMMFRSEAARVGVIFHELAHQKIYIKDDSSFNEAFAVFIQQEGTRRWFRYRHQDKAYQDYLQSLERRRDFNRMLLDTRQQLAALYASQYGRMEKLQRKQQVFVQLQHDYQKLKQQWHGYDGYDEWMQKDLNNAHLALVATYHQQVKQFSQLLDYCHGDLKKFYTTVEQLAALDGNQRKMRLEEIEKGNFDSLAARHETQ